ncbi:MAG: hypothetical protein AAF563_22620 [Pseudomonadota bacterium]
MTRFVVLALCLAAAACAAKAPEETATTEIEPAPSIQSPGDDAVGPDQLLHKADTEVRTMLGDPEFIWSEDGAAMWRYRGANCYVDVFLYEGEGVTYVDVQSQGTDERSRDACFRTIIKPAAG